MQQGFRLSTPCLREAAATCSCSCSTPSCGGSPSSCWDRRNAVVLTGVHVFPKMRLCRCVCVCLLCPMCLSSRFCVAFLCPFTDAGFVFSQGPGPGSNAQQQHWLAPGYPPPQHFGPVTPPLQQSVAGVLGHGPPPNQSGVYHNNENKCVGVDF